MSAEPIVHKTRIAPTPSGFLHLGNLFSFALTAAWASKSGAKIFLRIDDQDTLRVTDAYVQDIFDTLQFMDISWQEGPRAREDFEQVFSQRHRQERYNQALEILRNAGMLYACDCSRSQIQLQGTGTYSGHCRQRNLPLDAGNVSWRLKTKPDARVKIHVFGQGLVDFALPMEMQDMIVRRKDGLAAYQLSSLVDDTLLDIDFIVRGQDLWSSSLFQVYLADLIGAKGFKQTVFLHHVLARDEQGLKLSKSAGAMSIKHLREQGKSREEVYTQMGKLFGLKKPVRHWSDLVNLEETLVFKP